MNNFKIQPIEPSLASLDGVKNFAYDSKLMQNNFLSKIKFPLMILDTEFVNNSHNKLKRASPLYVKKNPVNEQDCAYIIQYAIFNSFEELVNQNPDNLISPIILYRKMGQFSFEIEYKKIKHQFIDVCVNNKVAMFMCSGGASDFKLIKRWTSEILSEEQLNKQPFIKYNRGDSWQLNTIDAYDILKACFSFENKTLDGEMFIEPKRLKKGAQNKEMLQFASFSKLFDWTSSIWTDFVFKDEKDKNIYDICVTLYEYYSYISTYQFEASIFRSYNNTLQIAIDHCWNDVYKIIIFMNFCLNIAK